MSSSLENLSKFGFAEGLTKKLASDVLVRTLISKHSYRLASSEMTEILKGDNICK